MSPPTRILVPTNFSDGSCAAQDYASTLAAALGARLHVLHVIPDRRLAADLGLDALPTLMQRIEHEVSQRLETCRTTGAGRGLDVITDVVHGLPEDAIVEYAEAQGIDLIVVGRCDDSGSRRARLRRVAMGVLQKAPCPVLAVGGTHGAIPGGPAEADRS